MHFIENFHIKAKGVGEQLLSEGIRLVNEINISSIFDSIPQDNLPVIALSGLLALLIGIKVFKTLVITTALVLVVVITAGTIF